MEMKDFVWITPDPQKVMRFVLLPPRLAPGFDVWTSIYIGERLLIHNSYLPMMISKGFMVTEELRVFETWQEAEESKDKMRFTT